MQLTYRGTRYTVDNQPVEIVETPLTGRFLGARFQIKAAKCHPPKRQSQQLSYRLTRYSA